MLYESQKSWLLWTLHFQSYQTSDCSYMPTKDICSRAFVTKVVTRAVSADHLHISGYVAFTFDLRCYVWLEFNAWRCQCYLQCVVVGQSYQFAYLALQVLDAVQLPLATALGSDTVFAAASDVVDELQLLWGQLVHLDEDLEVIAWQVGDLVHREGQLHLEVQQGLTSCCGVICSLTLIQI